MVTVRLDIPKVMNKVKGYSEDALVVVGALGVTLVSKQIRANGSVVTSNLVNSIAYSCNKSQKIPGNKTDGKALTVPEAQKVKIGTTVVYAPRVEFGFVGTDSLGRTYNQQPKSFLRVALKNGEKQLNNVYKKIIKGKLK